MALKNSDGKVISKPAGKDDKIVLTVVDWTKLINMKDGQEIPVLKSFNSKKVEGILSTEYQQGWTVKAYNNGPRKGEQSKKGRDIGSIRE